MKQPYLREQFESGLIAASDFRHREHVQVAYEMLKHYSYIDATTRYCHCVERLAQEAGAHEKFNVTITMAFMSLIAERLESWNGKSFDHFYAAHPELKQNPLRHWYSEQRLNNPVARRVFLMPEP